MESEERKIHWNDIYESRKLEEVSWYQAKPSTSLAFLKECRLPKSAKIIDIGGGDSLLVDHLLELGYENITVLDISEKAINKAKKRLEGLSAKVKWIIADVMCFEPMEQYDFWHDRATFHFLTNEVEILKYITTAYRSLNPNGVMLLGTFSEHGPEQCSGLKIKRYSEFGLSKLLEDYFEKIKCLTVNHKTPSGDIQNFLFCSFRKLENT